MLGRPDEARRATALRRAVYYEIHDLKMVAATINDEIRTILLPYDLGCWEEIDALLEEQARVCALLDAAVGTVEPPTGRVQACFLRGAWHEAARLLDDDDAWADPLVGHERVRSLLRAELQLARDECADAAPLWQILPEGVATAPGSGDFATQLATLRLLAALATAAGAYAQSRDLLDAHERWLAWGGVALGRAAGALVRANLARSMGDPVAGRLAGSACVAARADGDRLTLCRALRLAGEVADVGAGRSSLLGSLDLAERCGLPYEAALARLALSDMHRRLGERDEARQQAELARTTFARLGATTALAAASALLIDLAVPISLRPVAPFGLTAREADVLRLVAAGLANRAIAARLSVSPRTVSTHLEHIYAKLGVASRTAAIGAAR